MEKVHIYGPQFSNFVRSVQLVCEEKGIDYSLGFELDGKPVEFKGEQHGLWHPYKKLPVLVHGERVLAETSAICRYLDDNFAGPRLQPDDPWLKAQVDQWCQLITIYVDKAIVRDFLLELYFPKGEDGKPRMDVLKANEAGVRDALAIVARQLGDKPYLVGDSFTLADALAAPIVSYALHLPPELAAIEPDSKLHQYALRLEGRPAGAKVLLNQGAAK